MIESHIEFGREAYLNPARFTMTESRTDLEEYGKGLTHGMEWESCWLSYFDSMTFESVDPNPDHDVQRMTVYRTVKTQHPYWLGVLASGCAIHKIVDGEWIEMREATPFEQKVW